MGEIASGLEEIIAEMDEEADHADLDRETKEGVVALSAAQDLELTKGRVTPKANKKPFVRPTPDREPIKQKDTLDSMLIKVLFKKADEDTSVERDRKHGLEDRNMLLLWSKSGPRTEDAEVGGRGGKRRARKRRAGGDNFC